MTSKKGCPGALAGAARGESSSSRTCSRRHAAPSSRAGDSIAHAGMRAANHLTELSERFLAAMLRAAEGYPRPPLFGGEFDVPVEAMATTEHRAVFRSLLAFIEMGVVVTDTALREVASQLGYTGFERMANSRNADLVARLPFIECTAAGLYSYGRLLVSAHRKRLQIARLWRVLWAQLDDMVGDSSEARTPIVVRRVRRKRGAST